MSFIFSSATIIVNVHGEATPLAGAGLQIYEKSRYRLIQTATCRWHSYDFITITSHSLGVPFCYAGRFKNLRWKIIMLLVKFSMFCFLYHFAMAEINVNKIYNHYKDKFEKIRSSQDYAEVLKVYNQKGLLKCVADLFDFKGVGYTNFVLHLLKTEEKDKIVAAIRPYMPQL